MGWRLFRKNLRAGLADLDAESDRWRLVASPDGVVRIRSRGPSLRYDEVREIVERLRAARVGDRSTEIVFDFAAVEVIEAPWTPVLAQLIDFARRAQAPCRLASLHGQPGAVAKLLLNDRACRSLLHVEGLPPAHLN